jgi:hypothetical protein
VYVITSFVEHSTPPVLKADHSAVLSTGLNELKRSNPEEL